MIDRRRALPLVAGMMLLPGCSRPTYAYRWKLTLELDVDGVTRRGAQVLHDTEYTVSFPHRGGRSIRTGQALYIDLGPGRRPLVTLLYRWDDWGRDLQEYSARSVLSSLFEIETNMDWSSGRNDGLAALIKKRGPRQINTNQLPALVTFRDVQRPETVMDVDPGNLEEALGPGVTWRSRTLEFTDDPVTTEIVTHLPWLDSWHGRFLDGRQDPVVGRIPPLPGRLHRGHFIRKGS